MPLVFVHGVNVRKGKTQQEIDAWDQVEQARNASFRTIAFADRVSAGVKMHFENPYWGDLASTFAFGLACIPGGDIQSFGPGADKISEIALATTTEAAATGTTQPDQTLVTLAKQASLAHAVDAVVAATVHTPNLFGGTVDDLSAFAERAFAYAEANPNPAWLQTVTDDSAFLDELIMNAKAHQPTAGAGAAAPGVEAFGVLDNVAGWLKAGASQLGNALDSVKNAAKTAITSAVGKAATPVVVAARPAATTLLGTFIGDVFVYIQHRGTDADPGPIVKHVIAAIDNAITKKTPQDNRLILVGHSMGGNILYDILTYYRPDIQCDLVITAGTQVGLMEELKVFNKSDKNISEATHTTVARPANVAHWINIFDMTDIFGFATKKIFDGIDDFKFDTQALPVVSHGAYFERPRFYARLRERVNAALT